MMQPYPFFGFPHYRRGYPYYSPYYNSHNVNVNSIKNEQKPCSPSDFLKKEQGNFSRSSNFQNNDFNYKKIEKCIDNNEETEECFEIFGLKLHFDDLLIIALLFFLYQEDVKDTYLYISLILLLLS